MSQPVQPRPQPVLDEAKIAGMLQAVFVTGGGLYFLVQNGITSGNWLSVTNAFGLFVTAVLAFAGYVVPAWRGKLAAAQVTPLESPQVYGGAELLTAAQWINRYGKHAKQPEAPAVQQSDEEYWDALKRDHYAPSTQRPVPFDLLTRDGIRPTPYPRDAARGIHDHPWRKLGKKPPIPGRAAVPFGKFLKTAPAHPIADVAPTLSYPMDRNDQAGDCVVAGLDHTLQTICAALGVQRPNWTDGELLAYYRTQNPGMHSWADAGSSADGGMVIQMFLEYLVAQGVILAFGKIDHTNPDEMRAATYLGLAIVTGETLETAQQSQAVWDYKKSGNWGGHCTCTVGYPGATRQTCVSWGAEWDMTEAFISHQLDEAWFVLTQEHVDHPAFRAGYDVAGFAAAVAELTNGKVVVPIPAPQPPPAPQPVPTPTPAPVVDPNITPDMVTWARHVLALKGQSHATIAVAHEILGLAGQ